MLVSLVLVVLRGLGPPLAFLVFPASTPPLVSLIPGDLLVPGPLAFLVLPALYVAWFRIKRPDPDVRQNMHIEELPEIRLGGPREVLADAGAPELETTAHL